MAGFDRFLLPQDDPSTADTVQINAIAVLTDPVTLGLEALEIADHNLILSITNIDSLLLSGKVQIFQKTALQLKLFSSLATLYQKLFPQYPLAARFITDLQELLDSNKQIGTAKIVSANWSSTSKSPESLTALAEIQAAFICILKNWYKEKPGTITKADPEAYRISITIGMANEAKVPEDIKASWANVLAILPQLNGSEELIKLVLKTVFPEIFADIDDIRTNLTNYQLSTIIALQITNQSLDTDWMNQVINEIMPALKRCFTSGEA